MQQPMYKNSIQATSGIGEEVEFGVEINETVFRMLSSDVYNDPIQAVMREWSTNACDVCISAGLPVLYDVHLPTAEEPMFYVRDYGTGLEPSELKRLFSKLGYSTKRASKELNGCLGIGRMAGLAVADAFTIESFFEGTHYTFVVSMKDGKPVILSLSEIPTQEPNGLKMAVSVLMDDIASYKERAVGLYKYFDYKPHLNVDIDVTYDTGDKDWFVSDEDGIDNYVLMSQVLYQIPSTPEIKTQGFKGIVMKAPPGSVSFNPGREALSLNQQTINYVNTMFASTAKAFVAVANQEMAKCTTDREVFRTYWRAKGACPNELYTQIDPTPFLGIHGKSLIGTNWRGATDIDYVEVRQLFCSNNQQVVLFFKNNYHTTAKDMRGLSLTAWHFYDTTHILVDTKTTSRALLNNHFRSKPYVSWSRAQGVDLDEFVEKTKPVLDALGLPYKLLSEVLPKTVSTPNAPREGLFTSSVSGSRVLKSTRMTEKEATGKDWLYLKLSGSTPILSDTTASFANYQDVYKLLRKTTDIPEVRGVPKKYQKYVDGLDNWIDYETYVKQKIQEVEFVSPTKEYDPLRRFINSTNASTFPPTIEACYNELEAYDIAKKSVFFVSSEVASTITSFGGTVVPYAPYDNDFYEKAQTQFPLTMKVLTGAVTVYSSDTFVQQLAATEDALAVHTTV